MKKLNEAFKDYAENHTDLLPNIIAAFEKHIVNSPLPSSNMLELGDEVDDLIRDCLCEYSISLEEDEEEDDGYEEVEQPSYGYNGSVVQ